MSVPSTLTVGEMEGLPSAQKSAIRAWYDRVKSGGNMAAKAKAVASSGAHGMRAGGESLLMGGILGAASVELKTGLDYKKVPVDAVVGVLGILGSVGLAATEGAEYSADLRNSGAAALAIFSFRKTQDLLAEKKRKKGGVPGFEAAKQVAAHGESDFGEEDPIIAAARFL